MYSQQIQIFMIKMQISFGNPLQISMQMRKSSPATMEIHIARSRGRYGYFYHMGGSPSGPGDIFSSIVVNIFVKIPLQSLRKGTERYLFFETTRSADSVKVWAGLEMFVMHFWCFFAKNFYRSAHLGI